jgi:hypothetical protein
LGGIFCKGIYIYITIKFCKAFDAYSKLWIFQQINRSILDSASHPLKRPEIGEIGSKIGQLYFQFYLRKSDPKV